MELQTIVVGVDFSKESEIAANEAMNIARHTGAQVVLVHVGTVIDAATPQAGEGSLAEWENLVSEQLSADRTALETLRERLAGQGVEVSHMIIDGFADTGLVKAAKDLGAQLLVTGSHGRTGLSRWLLGSIAERTVRLADSAVLTARPGADSAGGYKSILIPTDFSEHSEAALEMALLVAAPGALVELVHFWQLPIIAAEYAAPIDTAEATIGPMREAMERETATAGAALVEKYSRERLRITFETAQAGAAHGIVDRVKEEGRSYDAVILGSHGRRGFRRFILGSVAETVVRHAPCSVMVVHHGDRD